MPTCKYCKAEGLTWSQENGRWRLLNAEGKKHDCKTQTAETEGGSEARRTRHPVLEMSINDQFTQWWDFRALEPCKCTPFDAAAMAWEEAYKLGVEAGKRGG